MPYGLTKVPSVFQVFINEVSSRCTLIPNPVCDSVHLHYSIFFLIHRKEVMYVMKFRENQVFIRQEWVSSYLSIVLWLYPLQEWSGDGQIEGQYSNISVSTHHPKECQKFLGCANFYWGFSSVITLLTLFLKGLARTLRWTKEAMKAFKNLKELFTSPNSPSPRSFAPIYCQSRWLQKWNWSHPPKTRQSAQKSSIWVLQKEIMKLLAIKEELLVIKAFKIWKSVWISSKTLNSQQDRWTLFFTFFNFILTYRPWCKNIKASIIIYSQSHYLIHHAGHPTCTTRGPSLLRARRYLTRFGHPSIHGNIKFI